MQLDGVGSIALLRTRSSARALPRVKLGSRAHPHFHPVGSTPATAHQIRCPAVITGIFTQRCHAVRSQKGGMVGVFIHKILQVPCVAVSCGLHLQLRNVFFQVRHGSGRNSTRRPSFCTVATRLPVIRSAVPHGQRQVLPVASFILSG